MLVTAIKKGVEHVEGLAGNYNTSHSTQLPIQIGIYNGDSLISAPVQLLPLAKGSNFNLNSSVGQAGVCVQACAGQGTTTRNSQLLQGVVT